MPRYIDADALKLDIDLSKGATMTDLAISVIKAVKEAVTAEVVPKSEVERLQEALSKAETDAKNYMKVAEYQQSLSVKRYHEIKRLKEDIERLEDINERDVENLRLAKEAVAMEIFEEIENEINNELKNNYKVLPQIEISNVLWNRISGRINALQGICEFIAELKKKYTEGVQNES